MSIKLSILPHQTECLERALQVFDKIRLDETNEPYANPLIDRNDTTLKRNIWEIQENFNEKKIPKEYRTYRENNFGIDIRMETGTGKTYCYTRLIYELNKKYGFHKFIVLVPTTPIKEGTKSFIISDYANKHFLDLYPNKKITLSVLNAQKKVKGKRKLFPQAISEFARGTKLEKTKISVLLMSSGMLLSKKTMDQEYDQALFGTYSNPYDTLKATRPIVIIDEPHKFKIENKAYTTLIEKINPQCIIRLGATFPSKAKSKEKDYNNLIYNLGACEAFNNNLVKGVATQMIEQENLNEVKIKLLDFSSKSKFCKFKNEKTNKNYELNIGDSLTIIDENFKGISIESIGKTEDDDIKTGVVLSNGQILSKGEKIYSSIYGETYQSLMLKQAIENHIKQERENFFRERKIKTLSLFFIDSVYSYRDNGKDGTLRKKFEKILKENLEEELKKYSPSDLKIHKEYVSYLKSSLKDISATNGGYFSEDNSTSDEEIQKEVEQILRDKQSLLTFKDDNGNWNTRRFIFSKWTLREGWDNPNVFQICKLRSSGSEISKLQEVGRGLRLPVDEYGNRISNEQFYLTYLIDHSEKDFAENLIQEVTKDGDMTKNLVVDDKILEKAAQDRGIEKTKLFAKLLLENFLDDNKNIILENMEKFFVEYPEFSTGLQQNKIIDKNKNQSGTVGIRREKFNKIRDLWKKINQKYYLKLDEISEDELYEAILEILKSDIADELSVKVIEKKISPSDGSFEIKEEMINYYHFNENMEYNTFLKQIQKSTGISFFIMHKALCAYNKIKKLEQSFFNQKTVVKFTEKYQEWFEKTFLKRFSYKALEIDSLETQLTDINGEPKERIIQGLVGIMKDERIVTPDNFLYDTVVFDSGKEKENIESSNIKEVVVFGKIPRKSIQVPLYFGGTTSPDFMYIIKKDNDYQLNLIVETKDVKKNSDIRNEEEHRILSAEEFFKQLKADGVNISFKKQIKSDNIIKIIKDLIENERQD
ncbi:type III restriction-modification system endonuclease [Fusobacterium massiliense]|uniref:type III restriction-modification system endonuclease n=1 Tax=Fusobacterium massiliense TaxID=1852365 RepID=UPI0009402FD8|nr:type III restriction-modification system endonuclease [Fusobacterium massiliense]